MTRTLYTVWFRGNNVVLLVSNVWHYFFPLKADGMVMWSGPSSSDAEDECWRLRCRRRRFVKMQSTLRRSILCFASNNCPQRRRPRPSSDDDSSIVIDKTRHSDETALWPQGVGQLAERRREKKRCECWEIDFSYNRRVPCRRRRQRQRHIGRVSLRHRNYVMRLNDDDDADAEIAANRDDTSARVECCYRLATPCNMRYPFVRSGNKIIFIHLESRKSLVISRNYYEVWVL